ncbi:MAG: hypothetical protein IJZ39_07065 [Oscillospiraceae bacterium]|nr:hypothetical protein [Oscillospiraceae bacterium]
MAIKKDIPYRDKLVAYIKDAGQDLIDRAEQMVGPDTDLISEFNIHISFPQELGSMPIIEWSTEVISKNAHKRYLNGE